MKYLTIRHHAPEDNFTALHLSAPDWAQKIWSQGFYPFAEPFVYDRRGEKIISFTPFFQQLNYPFYLAFGTKGLYVISTGSVLLLWLAFLLLLRRMNLSGVATAAALFLLTICSPLTLYGAVFWEHSLSVTLFFCGIFFLLRAGSRPALALLQGLLTGLSAWLRPEAFLLCGFMVVAVIYNHSRQRNRVNLFFLAGILSSMLGILLYNAIVYGNPGGAHSYQLHTGLSIGDTISRSMTFLLHMVLRLVLYFPLSLFPIIFLVRRKTLPRTAAQPLAMSLLFILIAPFFVPNGGGVQWGPRYFLLIIPLVLVAGIKLWASGNYTATRLKVVKWAILPVIVYSAVLNTWGAYSTLRHNYAFRVKPCLDYLQHNPCKTIIVQNQYVAQELAELFKTKQIFRAENMQAARRLQTLLQASSVREAIFVEPDKGKEFVLPCSYYAGVADAGPVLHLGSYHVSKCSW